MFVFVTVALVGFGLLLVSALFGGGDHDMSVEADHDIGFADHPSPFSLRVISLFLTAFGAVGAMTRMYGGGYTAACGAGMAAGAVVGFAGYKLIALFMGQQSSSLMESEELVGSTAQVSVAIPPGGIGQVSVSIGEKRIYPMARAAAAAGAVIAEGEQVKIVRSEGATVYVEKLTK